MSQENPFGDNPYQAPMTSGLEPKGGGADALAQLKAPAICMLIVSCVSILAMLIDLVMRIININAGNVPVFGDNPAAEQGAIVGAYVGAGVDVLNLIAQFVVIAGCMAMLKGRGKSIASMAAVLSMIPCISGCCILNIPFGIWAFIVLKKPEVDQALDAAERMPGF